jgi:RNA polymerase sigma factor (sigma-70 family)
MECHPLMNLLTNEAAVWDMAGTWHEQLYAVHRPWLLNMITLRLPPAYRHHAEDLSQDVLADAWTYRKNIPANPRMWLYRRAEKRLRRFERDHRLEKDHTFPITDDMLKRLPDMPRDPEVTIDIAQALKRLWQTEAKVVKLVLSGFLHHEIASELGISEATSRKRLERALKKLRARIGSSYSDGPQHSDRAQHADRPQPEQPEVQG